MLATTRSTRPAILARSTVLATHDDDMSMSFAREGSGGFDSSRHDRDPSPSPARGAARGGFGSGRHNGTSSPSPAASGGGAGGFERDSGDLEERCSIWKKTDFPTDEALRQCLVQRHEDLPRHIYLLDILGLQFRWVLTRSALAARSSPQNNAMWTTKRSTPGWPCTRTTVTFSKPCSIAASRHCGLPALAPSPSSPNTALAQNSVARRYGKLCSLRSRSTSAHADCPACSRI